MRNNSKIKKKNLTSKIFIYFFIFWICLFILFIMIAITWHYGVFKWVFQFLTSSVILFLGLIFIFSGFSLSPKNKIALGLVFIFILSPLAYLGSNYLFWHKEPDVKPSSFAALTSYFQNKWQDNPAHFIGAFIWGFFNIIWLIWWAKGNVAYLGRKYIAFNIVGFLLFCCFLLYK